MSLTSIEGAKVGTMVVTMIVVVDGDGRGWWKGQDKR